MRKIGFLFKGAFLLLLVAVTQTICLVAQFVWFIFKLFGAFIVLLIGIVGSLLILFTTLVAQLLSLFQSRPFSQKLEVVNKSASIIVVNWNGRAILEECLHSVFKAIDFDGGDHEVIVVDNGSSDDSVAMVQKKFPQVKLLKLDANYFYGGGNNRGIKEAKNEIIVLLNNDMVVEREFLSTLLPHFDDHNIFSVSSQIFFADVQKRREETGLTRGQVRYGYLDLWHAPLERGDTRLDPVLWGGGGAAAFNAHMLRELGGISELYDPFYWEDVDLSYRAWRRGWYSLVEPASIVHHKHQATSSTQFTKQYVEGTKIRNSYLFLWANILQTKILIQHLFFGPGYLSYQFFQRGFLPVQGYLRGLGILPKVLVQRAREYAQTKLDDTEIFALANSHYFFWNSSLPSRRVSSEKDSLQILFLCPYVPSMKTHAGAGLMYQTIRYLSEMGHNVDVVAYASTNDECEYANELKTFCRDVVVKLRTPAFSAESFQARSFLDNDFYDPEMDIIIKRQVDTRMYDVIDVQYLQMAPYLDYLDSRERTHTALVFTDHENQLLVAKRQRSMNIIRWISLIERIGKILHQSDMYQCLSSVDAEALKEYFPGARPTVQTVGIETDYYIPKLANHNNKNVVFVGYFEHGPNIDAAQFLVEDVWPLVEASCPDAHLYLVGKNPPPIVQSYSKSNISVTGFVPDTRPYFEKASIFVVPIRQGAGIRLKTLKAWAMRLAVVSTTRGAEGMKVINGKNILLADTAEDFAAAIIKLLNDPETREQLAESGYQTIQQHYTWKRNVQLLTGTYKKALSRL